jgi:osmoprotectant transport system ATP-binding protein
MRDGRLIQMAPADELLANPADEFVANFVGADRGLKRLRVRYLSDLDLGPPPSGDDIPEMTATTSLHNALSLMLADGITELKVTDEHGTVTGGATLQMITQLIAPHDGLHGHPGPDRPADHPESTPAG